ncbi:hypothetical protein ACAG25_08980 [Mycobacterium sp. pV006]|uniref:hypothetical protein n=1 Tax=Mycobacterium sp. pV006 TaxID=3238983 RepID=UPI00351AC0F4
MTCRYSSENGGVMSMTLEALRTIHGLAEQVDISQSTEIMARRGGRGFKFSFFYGPVWLLVIAGLGGWWYHKFRKQNPEKAKAFEQRVRGASAAAASRLKAAVDDKMDTGAGTRQYGQRSAATGAANLDAHRGKRFNPPPNWPTPPAGWTPDADWQPDPSWPPAPPGWQFWVA